MGKLAVMNEHSNKLVGKSKQAVGAALGNEDLVREGKIQEGTGEIQGGVKEAGKKVQDALGKMGDKLAAKRRQRAGQRPERARRDLDREY